MEASNIDSVQILIKHGQYLLSSFDNIRTNILESKDNFFDQKDVQELVKAVRDGKTTDLAKFPHLSQDKIDKYGAALRQSYSALNHYKDFQQKAQKAFIDLYNQSRAFELTWNYIFTLDLLRLFTIYVKLAVFLVQIKDVDKIAIVYEYCVKMSTKDKSKTNSLLFTFLKERLTYSKISSELTFLSSNLFGLFKGVISEMSRLLSAGVSYDWSLLNISDNPCEVDEIGPEFPFFKPEYIVMLHLQDLCECFTCFIITNYSILGSDSQFLEVAYLILAHQPNLIMHGQSSFDLSKIFEDVRKSRGKKSDSNIELSQEKREEYRKSLIGTRQYRARKLSMIISEFLDGYNVDANILCQKLVIVHSLLGFSHHTAVSALESFDLDNEKVDAKKKTVDVIPLIHRMTQLVNLMIAKSDDIQRFLVFNFREYDAPYLQHAMLSFNIPMTEYKRLEVVSKALFSIDVEEYDSGTRYDLTGLRLNLLRIMSSFNRFSTSHGVLHLAPLFNLVSSIYYRVNTYTRGEYYFTEIAPLQTYWRYIPVFYKIAENREAQTASSFPAVIMLTNFYPLDYGTVCEFPLFPGAIHEHIDKVLKLVTKSVLTWAKSLQNVDLQPFIDQTSVSTILAKNGKYEAAKKMAIADMRPGDESKNAYRQQLAPIFSKLSLISDTFGVFREIGTVTVFGKTVDTFSEMKRNISGIMVQLFKDEEVTNPFQLKNRLQMTQFIICFIMTAAKLNPGPVIFSCMTTLTQSSVAEKDGVIAIESEKLGKLSDNYVKFFSRFFKELISKSLYSTASQCFINAGGSKKEQFKADVIQVFASKSSIRVLHDLLGTSGIACIDILAADVIASLYSELVQETKKCNSPQGQMTFLADPFNLPNAAKIMEILSHIGALSKYRQLLRQTVPESEKKGQFAFLSVKTTPQSDTILISRLKNAEILKVFRQEWFADLIKAVFCAPQMENCVYIKEQNAFSNNAHLIGLMFDNVIGAIQSQDSSFKADEFYRKIVTKIYNGIMIGKENIKRKTVKTWNSFVYMLLLDHMAQMSYYLDYSILEPILPYQLIRSIYTLLMSNENK